MGDQNMSSQEDDFLLCALASVEQFLELDDDLVLRALAGLEEFMDLVGQDEIVGGEVTLSQIENLCNGDGNVANLSQPPNPGIQDDVNEFMDLVGQDEVTLPKIESRYNDGENVANLALLPNRGTQDEEMINDGFDLGLLNEPVQYSSGMTKKPKFRVIDQAKRFYQEIQLQGTYYSLEIEQPNARLTPQDCLHQLLTEVIEYLKNNSDISVKSGDCVGMSLRNEVCGTEPVYISLRRADQLSADVVLNHIMWIFDSNKEFFLNGYLTVQFDHVIMPHGFDCHFSF